MADQGYRVGFFANSINGDTISVKASIGGIPVIYLNGLSEILVAFTSNPADVSSNPLGKVLIGANEYESAINLKAFFENNNFTSASVPVNYAISNTGVWTITAFYNSFEAVFFENDAYNDTIFNDRIGLGMFSNNPTVTTAPKYFFEYANVVNDFYRCEIYQKNFTGTSKEISGRCSLSKNAVVSHLDPIRGTSLDLAITASVDLSFEDLYTQNEGDFTVKFYRSTILQFVGILKPDGIFQSFVNDVWDINVQAVDGLGLLSDLSFVNKNGSSFSGKMSFLDVIYNCLNRTGLQLDINTFVELYYDGIVSPDANTDVLALANINVDRFVRDDDGTIMSCLEVLTNVLTIFSAVITQQEGGWHIYRPNDIYRNPYPLFKNYETNNIYTGLRQINTNRKIGSQIDNFGLFHCNTNQQIEIKGAISAFRVGYKYGFANSLMENGKLQHEAGTKIYNNWVVRTWVESPNRGYLVIDPVSENGISFKAATIPKTSTIALDNVININLLDNQSIEFKTRVVSYGYPVYTEFIVRCGDYSLMESGEWRSVPGTYVMRFLNGVQPNTDGAQVDGIFDVSFSVKSAPIPVGGSLFVRMDVPYKSEQGGFAPIAEVKSIEIINTFTGANIVGEFHTVSRATAPSSIIKLNDSVNTGDSINAVYAGAIYKSDKVGFTEKWARGLYPIPTYSQFKPLLRIHAEDELRISQKPNKLFTGDVFGYVSYLARIEINNIKGFFMPISWTFDSFTNITSLKSLELYAPEISDINYLKTNDYGETVKPTIV